MNNFKNTMAHAKDRLPLLILGLILITALGYMSKALASEYSPEAKKLAVQIQKDVEEYQDAQKDRDAAEERMNRSAAAAKAKDDLLCAEYNAKYSRTEKKLSACSFQ